MTQKLTILFDLDGTLVDTAPDLMTAHNHVMKNFGYDTKSIDEIKNYVGQGAMIMIRRSLLGTAKKELSKITDKKIKDETEDWIPIETYFSSKIDVQFSHDLCPDCLDDTLT